jgi:hypothetical protein
VQFNEDYIECKKILISIVPPPLLVRKSCFDISATGTARKYHLLLSIKKNYDAYQFIAVAKTDEKPRTYS